jgi:hypothetical protein
MFVFSLSTFLLLMLMEERAGFQPLMHQRAATTFAAVPRDLSGANYSKDSLMLKGGITDTSYRVVLPSGMDPSLTAAEQKVAERIQASLAEDPKKSDLDLLKEELRRIIDSMDTE